MWLVVALICTFFEGVFTALEVATNAASRTRLRALSAEFEAENTAENSDIEYSKPPIPARENRAAQLLELLENPRRLSLLFLTVTSLTMWTAATSVAWSAARGGWNWSVQVAALTLILFCAEVLPLLIAARHPERVALRGVTWIRGAQRVLEPLISLLKNAGNLSARGLGAPHDTNVGVTPDELRTALATAEEEGVLESDERALLEGAMDFREKQVREVMTPASEIVALRDDATLHEALKIAMQESHSRLPVTNADGKIVGILAAKDLIAHAAEIFSAPDFAPQHRVRDLMRQPLWVESEREVAAVLEELRRRRSLMAIVTGADGQASGLVTLEDLLEEIVGEIQDEYDDEAPQIVREDDSSESGNTIGETTIARGNTQNDVEKNREKVVTPKNLANENDDLDLKSSTRNAHRILCDADVKVREVQRFWRENFGENVRLQIGNESAPSSLALRDFAAQIFALNSPKSARESVPESASKSTSEIMASALEDCEISAQNANTKLPLNAENFEVVPDENSSEAMPICGARAVAGTVAPILSATNFAISSNANSSANSIALTSVKDETSAESLAKNAIETDLADDGFSNSGEFSTPILYLEIVENDSARIGKVRLFSGENEL